MLLDEKPISALALPDVQKLVTESVCESPRLDYKQDWWGSNDEARREMLRDISAFANSLGGHMVLGVQTQRGLGAGNLECPVAMEGLPRSDYGEMISRSCRDNLDPPCKGIEVCQIELSDDRTIVVIRIPQSLEAPHMVTFKGLNQFWQRHGTDKQPMSTRELRSMIVSRLDYEGQLLRLVEQQQLVIRHGPARPTLYIWASPVLPLIDEVDVRDTRLRLALGEEALTDPFAHNCSLYSGMPVPSLQGVEAKESNSNAQFIALHRNGYLEFSTTEFADSVQDQRCIISVRVAIYLENFAHLVSQVSTHLQAQGPLAFGCSLLFVNNHGLYKERNYSPKLSSEAWNKDDLILGHRVSYDFGADRAAIIRHFNDLLWNAFHFDECPFYTSGSLQIP